MKNKSFLILTCLLFNVVMLKAQMSFEEGTWASIKTKAKTQKKHIFVDAFTTWCGPCKWMSKNVFTDKSVGEFYNQNYVNFKLDMEKGEGVEFAQNFKVEAYPTLLFFNPEGELVHQIVGAKDAVGFLSDGKDALAPEKQIFTLKKKYEKGERNPEFLRTLAYSLQNAYSDASNVAEEYLKTQAKKDLSTAQNWEFLNAFALNSSSEYFQYVLDNKKQFDEALGSKKVDEFIEKGIQADLIEVARSQDVSQLESLKTKLKKIIPQKADAQIARAELYFYYGDESKSFDYAVKYFDKYCDNAQELNQIAWGYFEKTDDKVKLEKALSWAKKSVSLEKNFYNTDTVANILFKLGKKEEALKSAEEAVSLGKTDGIDTLETENLIQRIKDSMK